MIEIYLFISHAIVLSDQWLFFKPESIETFTEKKLRTLILPYILTCLMVMLSSVFGMFRGR